MAGTIIVDRIESDASYASTINVAGQITFSNTVNFGAFAGTAPVAGFYLPTTNNLAFTTASTERVRIDNAGNVGIGTSSPSSFGSPLSVFFATNPTLSIVSGNANAYLRLYSTSDNNMYLTNTGGAMTMNTANTERMRITSAGDVGIGTTSPTALRTRNLEVTSSGTNDSAAVIVNKRGTGVATMRLATVGAATGFDINFNYPNTGDLGFSDLASATTRMIIDSSGRVIKSYQPYLHATVANGTTAINFGTTHANVTVPYNSIFTNTGNHFNTSTSTFTCPVAGIYLVYAAIQLGGATGTSGVGPNMQVTRSGAAITGSYHFVLTGNGYQKMECTGYVKCAANDTLSITLYTGSAMTAGTTEFNGDSRNALCIAYIG